MRFAPQQAGFLAETPLRIKLIDYFKPITWLKGSVADYLRNRVD